MKEFKSRALNKLMLSFGLFVGLMLFGQTSFAQSSATLESRKTKLETMQSDYANQPYKAAYIGEVITALDNAIANFDQAEDGAYPLDKSIFEKVSPTVLADYSDAELQGMVTRRTELETEAGGTDTREYHKLVLVLGANGM